MSNRLIQKQFTVYFVAACLSVLLSIISVSHEWVINPDAICYLQSASAMKDGLHTAMNLCGQAKWPFYSILIALVSHITTCSYLHAAYALNAIFSLMTIVFFIAIVSLLAPRDAKDTLKARCTLLWSAAFIILLAHDFNAVRQYIIRDHGYWAFYLLSLFFFLHYLQRPRWYFAGGWALALLIATFFRIEGFLFLVGVPWVIWLDGRQDYLTRLKQFFQLNGLNILLGALIFIWFYLHPNALHQYKRLEDLQFQLTHGAHFLMQRYYWQGNALIHYVLGHGTAWIGAYLLFVSLLAWYVMTLVNTLSIVYTLLVLYTWYQKTLRAAPMAFRALMAYLLINALITLAFLGENMFLSERYVMALVLTLMLWAPFAIDQQVLQWEKRRWPLVATVFLIVAFSIGGMVHFGYSKKYVYDAGVWLAKNVPGPAKIYSNDFQVMYYSDHFGSQIFTAGTELIDPGVKKSLGHQGWQKFDYIALRFTKKDAENNFQLLNEIAWPPLRVFKNKRGDKVIIYSTKDIAKMQSEDEFRDGPKNSSSG